jgi:N-acetylneuraminic acid mutarotase
MQGGAVFNGQLFVAAIEPLALYGAGLHAERYDPQADAWDELPGYIASAECCVPNVAAGGYDGKMYVISGVPGQNPTTFQYDPASDTWTTRAPMPAPIGYLQGGGLVGGSDGELYVVCGSPTPGTPGSFLIYDPKLNSWSVGPTIPISIGRPGTVATPNGIIYVFGNGVIATYNTSTKSWSTSPSFASEGMGAALAGNGKIYLVGGPPGSNGVTSNQVLVFDPMVNNWWVQTSLILGEENPAALIVNGINLYVFSGWNNEDWSLGMEEATIQ